MMSTLPSDVYNIPKDIQDQYNKELRETSGSITFNDRLTAFLYVLMRDHTPPGIVSTLLMDSMIGGKTEPITYCNGWLADYAHYIAQHLVSDWNTDPK